MGFNLECCKYNVINKLYAYLIKHKTNKNESITIMKNIKTEFAKTIYKKRF